jgi:uncharacterized membrane protein YkoI
MKRLVLIAFLSLYVCFLADGSALQINVGIAKAWAHGDNDSDGGGGGESDSDSDSDGDGGEGGDGNSGSGDDGDDGDDGDGGGTGAGGNRSGGAANRSPYEIDEIRNAVRRNKILPLSRVKEIVVARYGPEIVGIEIEKRWNRWLYEFKVISASGRLLKVYVNARSGKIVRVEND